MITISEKTLANLRIFVAVRDIFGNEHTTCFPLGKVENLPGLRAFTYLWIDEKGSYPTVKIESFEELLDFLKSD